MAEYIDRGAFLDAKRDQYCRDCDRRKGTKNGKYRILYDIGDVPCRACGIEDVLSDVEDFPAADVQPVKHGKNLKEEWSSLFECSICHWSCWDTYCNDTSGYDYCPNCGAKMDGEA